MSYDIQVSGLQAGQTYRFRVSAVNEAGRGRPSLPTEPVVAETQPGQPSSLHIFRHCDKNIVFITRKSSHALMCVCESYFIFNMLRLCVFLKYLYEYISAFWWSPEQECIIKDCRCFSSTVFSVQSKTGPTVINSFCILISLFVNFI